MSEWLTRGEASSDPDLRRFAEGIRRDEASVHAAVTERWSNGPVEGHVNRLKTIKRQMYGRAGFVLLRARVLERRLRRARRRRCRDSRGRRTESAGDPKYRPT